MNTHPEATSLLIAGLENLNINDNTPTVVLVGDNGAAPEA